MCVSTNIIIHGIHVRGKYLKCTCEMCIMSIDCNINVTNDCNINNVYI